MSLIIGVNKGETLHLNTSALTILDTSTDKQHIYIEVEGKEFLLNDREFIEILPTVFAAVGKARFDSTSKGIKTLPRLAIDAPQNIRITQDKHTSRRHQTPNA